MNALSNSAANAEAERKMSKYQKLEKIGEGTYGTAPNASTTSSNVTSTPQAVALQLTAVSACCALRRPGVQGAQQEHQ